LSRRRVGLGMANRTHEKSPAMHIPVAAIQWIRIEGKQIIRPRPYLCPVYI
jgi:hypothetical protein